MDAIFRLLDWRSGAKWMPYFLVIVVLIGIWAFLFVLFLSLIPPEGLI
jgi:ABC-type Na+ efflux pump permease subunit